jgi:hypothetical protein
MATPMDWTIEISVTDGTTPLPGVTVRGEVAGTFVGKMTTGEEGRARFQIPSSQKPQPLRITATRGRSSSTKTIAWDTPYFTVTLRPPWWQRLLTFLRKFVPKSKKGWAAAPVVLLMVVYAAVCFASWLIPGTDLFGYNTRCAQIAVEAAARPKRPGMHPPADYTINTVRLPLKVNVPQALSQQVSVTFTVDILNAVPPAGGELAPNARAFNEEWANYKNAVLEAAAKNEAPSAITCPLQEIAELWRLSEAVKGKKSEK